MLDLLDLSDFWQNWKQRITDSALMLFPLVARLAYNTFLIKKSVARDSGYMWDNGKVNIKRSYLSFPFTDLSDSQIRNTEWKRSNLFDYSNSTWVITTTTTAWQWLLKVPWQWTILCPRTIQWLTTMDKWIIMEALITTCRYSQAFSFVDHILFWLAYSL